MSELADLRRRVRQLEKQMAPEQGETFVDELTAGGAAEPHGFRDAVAAAGAEAAKDRRHAAEIAVRRDPERFSGPYGGSMLHREFPGLMPDEADKIVRSVFKS